MRVYQSKLYGIDVRLQSTTGERWNIGVELLNSLVFLAKKS